MNQSEKSYLEQLGERLQKARKNKKMKQEYVATQIKLSRSAIANHERGHSAPSLNDVCMYAEIYGVSLDYLLRGIEVSDKALYEKIVHLGLFKKKFVMKMLQALEELRC